MPRRVPAWLPLSLVFVFLAHDLQAQNRGRRQRRPALPGTVSDVVWSKDGNHVYFTTEEKRYRVNLESMAKESVDQDQEDDAILTPSRRPSRLPSSGNTGKYLGRPGRGRQYKEVESPDGQWVAKYQDWNVVLVHKESEAETAVTTEGDEEIHYGTASWVYGEELGQTRAMWWSADSKKLLFYKFDDRKVRPFYLLRGWSDLHTELYPEYYPKAGETNPIAELFIYDLGSKETVRVDVGGDPDVYIYGIRTTPSGEMMMLNRTDRLQRELQVLQIDLETGKCRPIVEETQSTWQTNSPRMGFLEGGSQFVWPTDKTGFTHYEVRNLDGEHLNTITSGDFQIRRLHFVDESENLVGFTGYSSKSNPYYLQYHLVGLDGKKPRRVTTLDYHHSNFQLSPDGRFLVAQYEDVNRPPSTALYDTTEGTLLSHLAQTDPETAKNLAEMFSFKSACGKFYIYGVLYKPEDFDPTLSYPLINSLYAGPGSNEFTASYVSRPRRENGRGYLVVRVNNRGTGSRGKAFLSAAYGRLGDVDIQDHADAVRLLRERPYIDGSRVGIVGHSYGGYMAAMGILKHPDVYTASVARAAVTDWRNYDTIYTERYMSTPQLNKEGYDMGSAMTHVDKLQGKLLIMHGMVDDNVHPNNAFQLIEALDKAGKTYESRFWPNAGHGLGRGSGTTQQEFFDRVLRPNMQ